MLANILYNFKKIPGIILLFLLLASCDVNSPSDTDDPVPPPEAEDPGENIEVNENLWINGFLAAWHHNPQTEFIKYGMMTAEDIDWDAITHLTYYTLYIGADGKLQSSLDPAERNNFNTDRIRSIVSAAKQHDTKIIFSIGDWGNYQEFSSAISTPQHRADFIETIDRFIEDFEFDGVNLNLIPIRPGDENNYLLFIEELSQRFDALQTAAGERPVLAVSAQNSDFFVYKNIQEYADQINIFTFEMAQPWEGWQAWHGSALYNDSLTFEQTPENKLPSVHSVISRAVDTGLERKKLGISIDFYGHIWYFTPLLGTWSGWPDEDFSIYETVQHSELSEKTDLANYNWDETAKAAYKTLENPVRFISFENEESVKEKIDYAKQNGLGGILLWDIGGGFYEQSAGPLKNPLLTAVKNANRNP